MKDYSVAQIKKGFKTPLNQFPKPGSRIRKIFDLFNQYKGHVIDFGDDGGGRNFAGVVASLKTFYGMDLVHVGKGKWKFVGEYTGSQYVSYENEVSLKIKVKDKY